MRHTLVIEIPDGIAEANLAWREEHGSVAVANLTDYIEQVVTGAVQSAVMRVAGQDFRAEVVEYHYEQMTEPQSIEDMLSNAAHSHELVELTLTSGEHVHGTVVGWHLGVATLESADGVYLTYYASIVTGVEVIDA